jgi:dipeptidyl aminopeptidase/acylaminoacyl peptidase
MSADRDVTRTVRSWLRMDEHESANRVLANVLDLVDTTPQRRPLWRAWRKTLMTGTTRFVAAGVILVAVVAVGTAVYFSRPDGPSAIPSPAASASPTQSVPAVVQPSSGPPETPQPTQTGTKAPWVVFLRGDGRARTPDDLWAMRVDGSEPHEILPSLRDPNIAWSQDGSRLLVADGGATGVSHVYLAEVSNVIGPFVDTGFGTGADTACLEKGHKPFACQDLAISFAPDGQRVVLHQACIWDGILVDRWADTSHAYRPSCGFLTILDLRTGTRTELGETLGLRVGEPAWSPDGSLIAFVREPERESRAVVSLYVINADGTGVHEIDVAVQRVAAPRWSPDGTMLVFTSDVDYHLELGELVWSEDVYTVHADGTGLRRLTSDGRSFGAEWTLSGDIRFRDGNDSQSQEEAADSMAYSLMDADGGNLRRYADLGSLIGAIDPSGSSGEYAVPGYPSWQQVHWQPAESWQPAN